MVRPRAKTRPGAVVGGYELEKVLGTGGAAVVWLAKSAAGAQVAIKLLHPRFRSDSEVRKRMAREADILARLDHPGIASLIAVDLDHTQPYYVMELVRGRTLGDELGLRSMNEQHFSVDSFWGLFDPLCEAIRSAHQLKVVHRDLKPTNVMVTKDQTIKVLDFGIAKLLDGGDQTTRGRMMGSAAYMAPEQITGRTIDARADVFALSTIALEMLTLRRAWFRGDDGRPLRAYGEPVPQNAHNAFDGVLDRVRDPRRPVGSALYSALPEEVDAVLVRGMAVDPKERIGSVQRLQDALREALATGTLRIEEATRRTSIPEPSEPAEDDKSDPTRTRTRPRAAPQASTDTAAASETWNLRDTFVYPVDLDRGPATVSGFRMPTAAPPPVASKPAKGVTLPHWVIAVVVLLLAALSATSFVLFMDLEEAKQQELTKTTSPPAPLTASTKLVAQPRAQPRGKSLAAKADSSTAAVEKEVPPEVPERRPRAAAKRTKKARVRQSKPRATHPLVQKMKAALRDAREAPGDARRRQKLQKALEAAAVLVPKERRSRLVRITRSSALVGDLSALSRVAAEIERAARNSS